MEFSSCPHGMGTLIMSTDVSIYMSIDMSIDMPADTEVAVGSCLTDMRRHVYRHAGLVYRHGQGLPWGNV